MTESLAPDVQAYCVMSHPILCVCDFLGFLNSQVIQEHILVCVCTCVKQHTSRQRRKQTLPLTSLLPSPSHFPTKTARARSWHACLLQTCLCIYLPGDPYDIVSCHARGAATCIFLCVQQGSLCQHIPHPFKWCIMLHSRDIPMEGYFRCF